MKKLVLAWFAALVVMGCVGGSGRPVNLPPVTTATKLGVGDVFELHIVGEDKLPTTFTVAPDGSVDVPYIKRVRAEGLEPQELARTIRTRLMAEQILTDPSVSVSVKEYNSQHVDVLGEVQKPGSIPMQPGMKLLRAIAMAGGFNTIANKGHLVLRRRVPGGTVVVTVSAEDIIDNKIPDPPLQAGDSINVEQRVF